jgi:hypothetical protein
MKLFKLLFFTALFLLIFENLCVSHADSKELPSINVINLIRSNELGHDKDNLLASLKDQYTITHQLNINATWLLQYYVLENTEMVNYIKHSMQKQELGLLFEIDRNFTSKSGVAYRGQGPWYFSDGLLLSSYDADERRKLIDTAFAKFYSVFGYYPKTVGAWYIGADSLNYMQQKYGIVATLKASDQFNLDTYTIWGSPWDVPYINSKENQLIPARDFDSSSKVVNLQWAARDPNRGYVDPLYGIQDFPARSFNAAYVNYMADLFLKENLDNFVFGLENGGNTFTFNQYYKVMLEKAKELEKSGKIKISLAKDFATGFLKTKEILPSNNYLLANDYKNKDQAFWYSTTNYRVYIQKSGENIYLTDLRNYSKKINEDFITLNNSQGMLTAAAPKIYDSVLTSSDRKLLLRTTEPLTLSKDKQLLTLKAGDNIIIGQFAENQIWVNENGTKKEFNFNGNENNINTFNLIFVLLIIYFVIIYLFKKNLINAILLFVPLTLARPYLPQGSIGNLNFILDKKELFISQFFANSLFLSETNLIIFTVCPLVLLIVLNFILTFVFKNKYFKLFYYVYFLFLIGIYSHIFYFALDKKSLAIIVIINLFLFSLSLFALLRFPKTLKQKFTVLMIFISMICIFDSAVLFSRSHTFLASFELQALNTVNAKHKDVIFVEQIDFNVKPIYKAIKPFLLENISLAEKLTNTKWTKILRPSNDILGISNYDNKLIFVAKYLGSDLSPFEQQKLGLKKIFDNYQIAIYEKN